MPLPVASSNVPASRPSRSELSYPTVDAARIKHPTPQSIRPGRWLVLDGKDWRFAFDDDNRGRMERWFEQAAPFDREIRVPYAYQAAASGIGDTTIHPVVWYRKSVTLTTKALEEDTLLHFGAVDFAAQVWVNGKLAGSHVGGHVPFTLDVGKLLAPGKNDIVVRAEDGQSLSQVRGKQSDDGKNHGIDYTNTTGIWRPVWLERVPAKRIEDFELLPRTDGLVVQASTKQVPPGAVLEVEVRENGVPVATKAASILGRTATIDVAVPNPQVWTFSRPALYDLLLRVRGSDGQVLDTVESYAGLRSIETGDGEFRLNGKKTFLFGALDQNYRDSTLMSSSVRQNDAEVKEALGFGFNFVRIHQTTPDPRKMFAMDLRGLGFWGEMPSYRSGYTPKAGAALRKEWAEAVKLVRNHPSLLGLVPFNESWGIQKLGKGDKAERRFVAQVVKDTHQLAPGVPVSTNDGWEQYKTDILGIHDYAKSGDALVKEWSRGGLFPEKTWTGTPTLAKGEKYRGQPVMVTEAWGLQTGGHVEIDSYGTGSEKEIVSSIRDLLAGVRRLPQVQGLVLTQMTDVGKEKNGLEYANHKPKVNPSDIKRAAKEVLGDKMTWTQALPARPVKGRKPTPRR